jgi:AraC-like DNA-binding protein
MKNTRFVHDRVSSDTVIVQSSDQNYISKHYHSHLEIYYVTKGKYEITVNNETVIMEKDQLSICDSFDEHSYKKITDDADNVFITIPDTLTSKLDAWKKRKKFTNNFITDSTIAKKFKTFIDLLLEFEGEIPSSLYVEGLVVTILGLILQNLPLSDAEDKNNTILSDIARYINDHFTEKLTLDDVSKHFGYSRYYFSKLFNKNFNCHFSDYVNSIRCRHVISLLKTSPNQTILNAIVSSGFSSPSSFYKFFKEYYKISPSEIRTCNIDQLDFYIRNKID